MIGSGIPISQSSAPFPKPMVPLRCCYRHQVRRGILVPARTKQGTHSTPHCFSCAAAGMPHKEIEFMATLVTEDVVAIPDESRTSAVSWGAIAAGGIA